MLAGFVALCVPSFTAAFLDDNGLDLLIRSHEVKDEGYEIEPGGRVVTVFSAPVLLLVPPPCLPVFLLPHPIHLIVIDIICIYPAAAEVSGKQIMDLPHSHGAEIVLPAWNRITATRWATRGHLRS